MTMRDVNPFDPTDERTSDQSTQTAGGLGGGRRERGPHRDRDVRGDEDIMAQEDVAARRRAGGAEPARHYDEDADGTEAALPNNDPTLKTTI